MNSCMTIDSLVPNELLLFDWTFFSALFFSIKDSGKGFPVSNGAIIQLSYILIVIMGLLYNMLLKLFKCFCLLQDLNRRAYYMVKKQN